MNVGYNHFEGIKACLLTESQSAHNVNLNITTSFWKTMGQCRLVCHKGLGWLGFTRRVRMKCKAYVPPYYPQNQTEQNMIEIQWKVIHRYPSNYQWYIIKIIKIKITNIAPIMCTEKNDVFEMPSTSIQCKFILIAFFLLRLI